MLYYFGKSKKTYHKEIKGHRREDAMKTMKLFTLIMMSSLSAAYAANGTLGEGAGVLTYLFLGFFALIIVTQLVPAMILFFGIVKSVFTPREKTSTNGN